MATRMACNCVCQATRQQSQVVNMSCHMITVPWRQQAPHGPPPSPYKLPICIHVHPETECNMAITTWGRPVPQRRPCTLPQPAHRKSVIGSRLLPCTYSVITFPEAMIPMLSFSSLVFTTQTLHMTHAFAFTITLCYSKGPQGCHASTQLALIKKSISGLYRVRCAAASNSAPHSITWHSTLLQY